MVLVDNHGGKDDGVMVDFHGNPVDKSRTGGWLAAGLILGTELSERICVMGISMNMVTYLVGELHLSSARSANIVTDFMGTLNLLGLLGGFVADAKLGRYLTVAIAASFTALGVALLTLATTLPSMRPPPCKDPRLEQCVAASWKQLAMLYAALYTIAFGGGGIKSNVSGFGSDQFDSSDPKEEKAMIYFFNRFYFCISLGSLFAVTVLVYIQDNVGRGWGYGISAGTMVIAIGVLLFGTSLYRFRRPQGSPLTVIWRIVSSAWKRRRLAYPPQPTLLNEYYNATVPHSDKLRCLDKAAVVESDGAANAIKGAAVQKPATVTQVEEVKMVQQPRMAATLSPVSKQRAPFSPTKSPFAIGSNDDKLERAQARAARAAAIRRKPTVVSTSVSPETDSCLGKEQILDLFHNCIKLASENKINQKNTWELTLIDHLCEIIKVEEEDDSETNFQKASCTLEAGVKIYSMRVDSVHSEAYKVLGGINRVGQEDEKDSSIEDGNVNAGQGENDEKKEQGRKLSPLSTLESSFAAINVKKFDVAFVVDPLYHQTSAQFDEGGAKGLLLNNLGVYGNCQVLFDSSEVPGKSSAPVAQDGGAEIIDLSFASDCIERMVSDMLNSSEISPSLRAIANQLDSDDRRQSESYSFGQVHESPDGDDDVDADTFGNHGAWDFDHDDQASMVDEATHNQDTMFPGQDEDPYLGDEQSNVYDPDEDDRSEEVDSYLFLSLGFSTKQNAWAGPNHWKYRKVKDPEVPAEENGSPKTKKTKNKKADLDIDFSNTIGADTSHIFAPPKNPKTLLLPANRAPCSTRLPEDCHYQPEDLVKLFLLPTVLCLGKTRRKKTDEEKQQRDGFDATPSWDDGDDFGGGFDDEHAYSDVEEPSTLVSQPRQVSKIEVQYDKTSKQVDVHALKETLWGHIHHLNQSPVEEESPEEPISFKQVLANFPDSCRAAASLSDISPHLCFICLLHLANEHGLQILGCPNMDDLSIHLKPSNDAI